MFNRVLLFILIALIAVQSIDAMADAVKFHQPNTVFTEKHFFSMNKVFPSSKATTAHKNTNTQIQIEQLAQQNDITDSNQVDNDHCCYCHGVSYAELTDNSLAFYAIQSKEQSTFFNNKYRSTSLSPNLRPPII